MTIPLIAVLAACIILLAGAVIYLSMKGWDD